MIQFFAPDIATNPLLPESDSQHCIKVLRKSSGDEIVVVDGRGYRHLCRIIDPHPKHTLVQIISSETVPAPWDVNITVAVAPTKHLDRMEWLVEKLTEIGVNRLVPLLCNHSERREIKTERLTKIAVSAMKQSLKAVLPTIEEMTPIKQFIDESRELADLHPTDLFVGYCDDTIERKLLSRQYCPSHDVIILIGPEGDFSPQEIGLAMEAGFQPVSLGDCRLRTETAALMACQTIHVINQLKEK